MNKERRKRIAEAVELLQRVLAILDEVGSEERDAFDNLPEGIQNSERGEAMGEAADTLEEAASSAEEIVSNLEGIL